MVFYPLKDKIFYGWVIALAGFLISVIGIGLRYSFGIFLKSLEADFTMSRGLTSSVFSLYMLLCCLVAIAGGWAFDRYGPRKVGLLMGTFTGLSLLVTSQVNASWQLFISYGILLSLGTGATYTVVNATTSRWFFKKRGLAVGLTSSGGGLGTIAIAPFATYLISNFDWRQAFIVLGLIAWLGIALLSLVLKKDPHEIGAEPDGMQSIMANQLKNKGNKKIRVRLSDYSLLQAIRMPPFWLLGFTWLLLSLDLHLIVVHIVPHALELGVSPMDAALILSLMGITNLVGRLGMGRVSDTLGRTKLGITCTLVQAGSLLWLIWARELWMLYMFGMVFGFLWGGLGAVITALVGDVFGISSIGIIMGTMSAMWALGAAMGPALAGYIFDMSNSYSIAFAIGAIGILMAAPLMGLMGKKEIWRKSL